MRKPLKIILSTLASLLVLGIATVAILPFAVDVNDFKAQIEESVRSNTGRELTIEGNIELSVFPWLGISTGKMSLNNAEGFIKQPFAEITKGQIKVKLWPLLFKKLEVSEIVLNGFKLNLHKNQQGFSNWDDLLALIQKKEETKNPLKLLEIAGIFIKNAQISWDDQQAGQKIEIKDFNLNTDKLVFNQPIEMALDFKANYAQLALTEIVNFEGNLTVNEDLDLFSLKKLKLETQTEGKSIPSGKWDATVLADASFDLKQQKLKLAPLKIKTEGVTISSNALISKLQQPFKVEGSIHVSDFNLAKFLQQHALFKLPQMADERALTWLAADFHLNFDAKHAKLQNLEIQLDETTLKGSAQINDFSDLAINVNLALDKVNFDRYLPPARKEDNTQDLNTAMLSKAAKNSKLFPIDTLKKLNFNAQLTIDDLKLNNLTMQGVRLIFNAKNGFLQSLQSIDRLYQGAYNGKVLFDMSGEQPVLTLNQQLSHIQIEPLLTDLNGQSQIAGLIDANAKLEARGNTNIALKSSLNGHLSFWGKDMLIRGFNLQKIIDNGKILLSGTPLQENSKKDLTAFSKITGTAIISNGFLSNNDLSATAAKAKISGMGVLNLVSQQLDYKIIAVLLKEKLTVAHAKIINNAPVFINISGTFGAPAYQVDLAAMGVGL